MNAWRDANHSNWRRALFLRKATVLVAVGLGASGLALGSVDHDRIVKSEAGGEWLSNGRTYSEQRFSPLKQINQQTVSRLGLAWVAQFDSSRGQEATPLVADGVLYTSTAWSKVIAYDAKTGKQLWKYDPKVRGAAAADSCCDVVNRGVALWGDKVFVGTIDGRLIAIDARTGKEVWSTQTTDPKLPYTITGAPRVAKGKVLIGNGGAEYGVRGYLSAYDSETGAMAWRFYTTPNPDGKPDGQPSDKPFADFGNATWFGDGWKKSGGGGTVWDAITYDPVTDLVYIGVGNGAPWNHFIRSDGRGDNVFLSSIVAVKPDSGEYVWHYQTTPGDSWDYTATQQMVTADLTIGGRRRHVLMQAPKNGFFYVLDARTGELLSAEAFGPTVNWAYGVDIRTGRPVERPGIRYGGPGTASRQQGPAPAGSHSWKAMAFNPTRGLVYIPTLDTYFNYGGATNPADYRQVNGVWNLGMGLQGVAPTDQAAPGVIDQAAERVRERAAAPRTAAASENSGGSLLAWDPVAGKPRWRIQHTEADWGLGGVLTTAGDLVLQGVKHDLKAYAAADGKELWSHPLGGASAIAPPISYAIDGEQYIAIVVGIGGGNGMGGSNIHDVPQPGRLMVFKLGASMPFTPPATAQRAYIDVARAEPSAGDPNKGGAYFGRYCGSCHGQQAIYPDLRRSSIVLSKNGFRNVVHGGALQSRGMASFARFVSEDEVESIRAYLLRSYATVPKP